MISYEDIKKANESIRTTDIKGKEYAEVNQRIKAFRMVYPTGFITTEILKNEDGLVQVKATVGYRTESNELQILSTGTAQEKENSSFINKTSYIENCETSAVGRALGMAGFGIDTSVASAEEVENAILNQDTKPKICEDCGKSILGIKNKDGDFKTPEDIVQYSKATYGKRLCWDCIKKRIANND